MNSVWSAACRSLEAACRSLDADAGHAPAVGMRAIAMLWVIWFHGTTTTLITDLGEHFFRPVSATEVHHLGDNIKLAWFPSIVAFAGDTGVDLFLVLSGFLLGGMLSKELLRSGGSIDMVQFYVRRWFRILPAYASAMVISMLANPNERYADSCPSLWWSNLMFLNNIYPPQFMVFGPSCMVHTWSVAVEFQMYIFTPPLMILAYALAARSHGRLPLTPSYFLVMAVGWVACVALRAVHVDWLSGVSQPYTSAPDRVAPYLAGVAAAIAVAQHARAPYRFPGPRARAAAAFCSWTVLLIAALFGAEPSYFKQSNCSLSQHYFGEWRSVAFWHIAAGRPIVGLSAAYLLATSITGHAPRLESFLSARIWRPFAALSYSMYLLQYIGAFPWAPIFAFVVDPPLDTVAHADDLWIGFLVMHAKALVIILCTLPMALLNYVLIEHPLHMYGRHAARKFSSGVSSLARRLCHHGKVLV
ncbi:hypothetical protein AB1Y20_010465 [Prymnesium parvum]|uniref:Acyltransferase 3 domain-containing protein n=1 Tax=Prymnesium parvum TaxID=97485 RepID=A0AB34ISB6_PRYPA